MKAALSIALSLTPLVAASPIYTRAQSSAAIRQAKRQEAINGYNPAEDTMEINVSSFCTDEQRSAIIQAVGESGYLANALRQTGTDPLYQEDLNKFMGNGVEGQVQQTLMDNIRREWDLHTGAVQSNAYVHCGDDNGQMRFRDCAANIDAYTWDEDSMDNTGNSMSTVHHVVLCENWYNNPTLAERLADVAANPSTAGDVSSLYNNRASIWLHETTHWRDTVSVPRVLDYDEALNQGAAEPDMIYGPQDVENNAITNGAQSNIKIADAYSILAMSNLLTQLYEIPEALDSGNASASAMDSAEPHMHAVHNPPTSSSSSSSNQRRQEQWTTISGSMAQLDTDIYTATGGGNSAPPPQDEDEDEHGHGHEQQQQDADEEIIPNSPGGAPVPGSDDDLPPSGPPPGPVEGQHEQTVTLRPAGGNVVLPQGGEPVSGSAVINGVEQEAEGVIMGGTVFLNIGGQTYTGPIA